MTSGERFFEPFLRDMAKYTGELVKASDFKDWDAVYTAVTQMASACLAYLACVDGIDEDNH